MEDNTAKIGCATNKKGGRTAAALGLAHMPKLNNSECKTGVKIKKGGDYQIGLAKAVWIRRSLNPHLKQTGWAGQFA
jgi:hypothetical protein